MLYKISKIPLFLVFLILLMVADKVAFGKDLVDDSYREKVEIQAGRNTYVTGETIWYSAYTFSNQPDVYSKVVYVELVGIDERHIMGQILELSEGKAASSIALPDTLASGTYSLRAYTNWMRNFHPSHFGNFPIYVYNQYDDRTEEGIQDYFLLPDPDIYIENGGFIHNAYTRVKVEFQGWMSRADTLHLIEKNTGSIKLKFPVDLDGTGHFAFRPSLNEIYRIELETSKMQQAIFDLPLVERNGPCLNIFRGIDSALYVQPFNLPVQTANYKLVVVQDETTLWSKNITGGIYDTIAIFPEQLIKGLLDIQLLDRADHVLAEKEVYLGESSYDNNQSSILFATRSQVKIPLPSVSNEPDISEISVSIYKAVSSAEGYEDIVTKSTMTNSQSSVSTGGDFRLLLPEYQEHFDLNMQTIQASDRSKLFPVEDIGILYTGRVVNSINHGPLAGVDVILASKDTIPQLLFSRTDEDGRFFYLIDEYGEKKAMINLYLLGTQLSGSFSILLDNKFHFQQTPQEARLINLDKNESIIEYLDDESQRVLIQRAFGRDKFNMDSLTLSDSKVPFYGDDIIVVYPYEYFDLPNFEEIAREILPRTRYRKLKTGCEVTIFNIENGMRGTSPVVLLDGLPVKDYCDLYPLKSADINRVEIQSGTNVSGNLFYEGVLAVYTSSAYRKENADKNGRFFYDVSGYQRSSVFESTENNAYENTKAYLADFKNQLFWDPEIIINSLSDSIGFNTSDEEGDYLVDICGYTYNGQLVRIVKQFKVTSE